MGIGGLIVAIVSPLERADILNAFNSVFGYLGASVPLSRWVFALLVAAALVGIAFLGWPLVDRLQDRQRKKPAPPPPSHSYLEDTIEGIVWRWEWTRSGPYELTPFCPECDLELVWRDFTRGVAALQGRYVCQKCKDRRSNTDMKHDIRDRVAKEIERKARKLDKGGELPSE